MNGHYLLMLTKNTGIIIIQYPNNRHNDLNPFEWTLEEYNYTLNKLFNLNINIDYKYQQNVGPFFFECIWHFIFGENLIFNPPIINNKQLLYYTDIPFKDYSIFYKLNKILTNTKLKYIVFLFRINMKILII